MVSMSEFPTDVINCISLYFGDDLHSLHRLSQTCKRFHNLYYTLLAEDPKKLSSFFSKVVKKQNLAKIESIVQRFPKPSYKTPYVLLFSSSDQFGNAQLKTRFLKGFPPKSPGIAETNPKSALISKFPELLACTDSTQARNEWLRAANSHAEDFVFFRQSGSTAVVPLRQNQQMANSFKSLFDSLRLFRHILGAPVVIPVKRSKQETIVDFQDYNYKDIIVMQRLSVMQRLWQQLAEKDSLSVTTGSHPLLRPIKPKRIDIQSSRLTESQVNNVLHGLTRSFAHLALQNDPAIDAVLKRFIQNSKEWVRLEIEYPQDYSTVPASGSNITPSDVILKIASRAISLLGIEDGTKDTLVEYTIRD